VAEKGVAAYLDRVWPPWGRGRSLGPSTAAVGRGWSLGPRVGAVGVRPARWASCGRHEGMAGPLGPARLPWGRGWALGFRTTAVKAWLGP